MGKHGAHVISLAGQIYHAPAVVALLDVFNPQSERLLPR